MFNISIAQISIHIIKCSLQYILEIKSNQIKSNVGFRGEGKTGVPREKPRRKDKNEQQT